MADLKKNKYFEVKISFNDDTYDEIMNVLYLEGMENILEENGQLVIYLPEDENGNSKDQIAILRKSLEISGLTKNKDFSSRLFDDRNWNDEWEKNIEPVYIGEKIIVYPSWKEKDLKNTKDKILIQIDPKMSFGTGHNETTQLVLELMSIYMKGNEEKLFDFGCGTGILSIAGIKLGAGSAVAVDIDEDSIVNAKEYAEINEVQDKIKFIKGSLKEASGNLYDIVCANIISGVLLENMENFSNMIDSGGKLFLSGILENESQDLLEHLTEYDFEIVDIQMSSEWIGIYAVKI